MSYREHRDKAPKSVSVALVTVSTTRSEAEDRSGPLMAELVAQAGHHVAEQWLVPDGIEPIRACLTSLARREDVQALFFSGGSGISKMDLTVEAVTPWVRTWLPGFGELYRRLSYDEIGPAAMLSRACAAICKLGDSDHRMLVALLPGAPEAVRLALERLLLPELGHLIYEVKVER